jgi:hypothetical protein
VKTHYFNSTALRAARYDAARRVLSIQFTSGHQFYDYIEVPEHVFSGLLAASSAGQYFNEAIRDQYSVNQ